jgi:pimeloyl-ACP methyl ester carboxylesterase
MRVEVNGMTLNVFVKSALRNPRSEISLVFLHYFGGSSKTWTEVIDQLGGDYHCIAPDLRGFGDSEALTANYSIKDYADDVAG